MPVTIFPDLGQAQTKCGGVKLVLLLSLFERN